MDWINQGNEQFQVLKLRGSGAPDSQLALATAVGRPD